MLRVWLSCGFVSLPSGPRLQGLALAVWDRGGYTTVEWAKLYEHWFKSPNSWCEVDFVTRERGDVPGKSSNWAHRVLQVLIAQKLLAGKGSEQPLAP